MHRFYADGLGEIGSLVTLSEEDARHASRVLRMQPGDAAELFLDGRRFSAEIAEMTAEGVTARLISELPSTERHCASRFIRVCRKRRRWS